MSILNTTVFDNPDSMPAFNLNTQKILYYDPDQSRSTVSSFAEEIHPQSAEPSFVIFLLAEIRNQDHAKNQYILREIQNHFSRFFKSQQARLTESSFEEGLHQLNKILPTLFADRPPSFINSLSFVAGALSGNVLHFSQVGPATLLFVQHGSINEIGDHSLISNLNPLKLFKEIASGKMQQDDILFVSTTNFLDYFSQEKIKRILEQNISDSIAKGFDEYLLQAPPSTSFAALSLTLRPGLVKTVHDLINEPLRSSSPQYSRSMETLIEREQNTEEILSPKLFPYLKRKVGLWMLQMQTAIRKYIFKKPTRISPIITERKENLEMPLKYTHKEARATLKSLQTATAKLLRKFLFLFKKSSQATFANFNNSSSRDHQPATQQTELAPAVRSSTSRMPKNILAWFAGLQSKRKLLLIAAILIVAVFAQSIVMNGVRQHRADTRQTEEALQQEIQNAMDDIDAAMLYGDDARIQTALTTLQTELNTLQNSKGNDDLIAQVQEAITTSQKRLQKIREVNNPFELTDVQTLVSSARLTQVTLLNNTLLTLDPSKKTLIVTNIDNGESSAHSAVTSDTQIPILMTGVSGTAFILNQELSLSRFSTTNDSALPASFTPPAENPNLSSMASYSGRLYFVDISTNQILKSVPSGNGYSRPTPWLKEDIDLSLASAIAVDGSIFLGFQNGTIRKFTQGEEETFTLPSIQPPLQHIDALWTNETTSSLYVFDSDSSRVLIINKNNGNLLQQLVVSGTNKLEAFGVSESTQKIFVVSASKIYSIPLTEN